jgi:hypothetical protein
MGTMLIGENINKPLLWVSLMLIWGGSVITSKFNAWYAILAGATIAILGCYLNQRSIKWVTERKNGGEGAFIKINE